jgi:hypothetical protein
VRSGQEQTRLGSAPRAGCCVYSPARKQGLGNVDVQVDRDRQRGDNLRGAAVLQCCTSLSDAHCVIQSYCARGEVWATKEANVWAHVQPRPPTDVSGSLRLKTTRT